MKKFTVNLDLEDVSDKVKRWAEEELFHVHGYIYYKKKGRKITCFCGKCGSSWEGVTRLSDGLESNFERLIYAGHNWEATCEDCGNETHFKAAGVKKKIEKTWSSYCFIEQIDDYIVFRDYSVRQEIRPNEITIYEHTEISRLYLKWGVGSRKFVKLYSWARNGVGWYEQEKYIPDGGSNGKIYPPSLKKLDYFKYLPAYRAENCYFQTENIKRYYYAACKYPDFEFAVKKNLTFLVEVLKDRYGHGLNMNPKAKTPYDRLRINKERLKDFIEFGGSTEYLRAYQWERRTKKHYANEEIDAITNLLKGCSSKDLKVFARLCEHYSPAKIWKYIDRLVNTKIEGRYISKRFYLDYINMRDEMGYDIANSIYAFPKNCVEKHDELVRIKDAKRREERIREKEKQFANIAKSYKKHSKKLQYQRAGFIIRPAASAGEIIQEGATLHHCVGSSDTYMSEHNSGKGLILFLRPLNEPETPYVTVEISSDFKIKQWFGAYDKKPQEAKINKWLNAYIDNLKKKNKTIE